MKHSARRKKRSMSQKSLLDDRIAELEKDIAELEAEKAEMKKVEKQLAAMNVELSLEKKSEELYGKDLIGTTKIAELEKAIEELKAENEEKEMQLAAMNVELPLEKESELLDEHGKEPDEKDLLNKLLMATRRKNFANAIQRFLSLADAMDKDIRERLEATQENLDKIDKINKEVEKEREKDFDKIDQEEEKVKKRLDRIKATIREYTPYS